MGVVLVNSFFKGKKELLIDKGLGSSAIPGLGFISTIIRFPDFIMTSGAAIPINKVASSLVPILDKYIQNDEDFNHLSKTHRSACVADLVRICLHEDASENINYAYS